MHASRAICPQQSKAIQELIAAAVIPDECRNFELIVDANKPVLLRYEVNATEEQVKAIAEALARHPEEVEQLVREVIVQAKDSPLAVSVRL